MGCECGKEKTFELHFHNKESQTIKAGTLLVKVSIGPLSNGYRIATIHAYNHKKCEKIWIGAHRGVVAIDHVKTPGERDVRSKRKPNGAVEIS